MTDNLVQATARAVAKEDRYHYDHGDEYYEGLAKEALAVARPIIEREALEKAAVVFDVWPTLDVWRSEASAAIRALIPREEKEKS